MRILDQLERRRRILRMSRTALAQRSGVSLPTVNRMLSGQSNSASIANVLAISEALDMNLDATPRSDSVDFALTQARKKARQLVEMVQGTAALESQAVSGDRVDEMVEETAIELLKIPRRLWS